MSQVLESSVRRLAELRACPALCEALKLDLLGKPEPTHVDKKPALRLARAGGDTFVRMARRPWQIMRIDPAGAITARWNAASRWIHELGQAAIVAWQEDLARVVEARAAALCVDLANRAAPAGDRLEINALDDPRRLFAWALATRGDSDDPEEIRAVTVPEGDPGEAARFCLMELEDLVGAQPSDEEDENDNDGPPALDAIIARILAAAPQLAGERLHEWTLVGRDLTCRSLFWAPSEAPAYRSSKTGFRVVELYGGDIRRSWTTPEDFLAEFVLPRLVDARVLSIQVFLRQAPLPASVGEKAVFALLAAPFVVLAAVVGSAVLAAVVAILGFAWDRLVTPIPAPAVQSLFIACAAAVLLGILIAIAHVITGPD